MNDDDLQQLWQAQPAPAVSTFDEQDLARRARAFQRNVRIRNAVETVAAVLVVCCFGFYLWAFPQPLMRLGSALTIAATCFVTWQLHRRAASRPPAADASLPSRAFHRAQLVRQRDALRSVWLWYVAPFVPGMVLFRWGVEAQLGAAAPFARGLGANLGIAAVLVLVAAVNLLAARRLQKQIDQLDHEA